MSLRGGDHGTACCDASLTKRPRVMEEDTLTSLTLLTYLLISTLVTAQCAVIEESCQLTFTQSFVLSTFVTRVMKCSYYFHCTDTVVK